MTEEQVVLIINHTIKMLEEGSMQYGDYNYPIVQIYRYTNIAHLKGAEKVNSMAVEYAIALRIEFIPAGCEKGPVKEIYFKIFKAGTSGIVGGVFGWPSLDIPAVA